ncbi:MAG: hypothetical protein WC247_03165 [Porticoccaceae bacterium]|jgi:hypothetical protein
MKTPSPQAIEEFLRAQYGLWSIGKYEEMLAEFRKIAPAGLTIEYVGREPQDGWAALDEMWRDYGNKCPTELIAAIVNGNEAATYVYNHLQTEDGVNTLPSLETYLFENGRLHVRYFHKGQG